MNTAGNRMHAIEKIIAAHGSRDRVETGEIVNCDIDMTEVNDIYLQVIRSFQEIGGRQVRHPDRVSFVLDHYAPAPTIQAAHNQKQMREFVRQQGIRYLFDINAGICHQVLPENGLVWPGMILIATDSHTTTHGAFGALGTGVGATDMATILLTGELWLRVPEIMLIEINGRLSAGVTPKDVILHVIGTLKQDVAVYKAIEYRGSTISDMTLSGRMTLCNMAVEMGAKTTYIQPDAKVIDYVANRTDRKFTVYASDPGFVFAQTYQFDVEGLAPQVAIPHSVDTVVSIDQVQATEVDQIFIGTCTNGRLEDVAVAASILKGRSVHPHCRLVVIPASREVMMDAVREGYITTLLEAGATISAPGCGPCAGVHQGTLAPGEVGVTTSSRNFPGRMGSKEGSLYMTSPATAAATAIEGRLADPRKYLISAPE